MVETCLIVLNSLNKVNFSLFSPVPFGQHPAATLCKIYFNKHVLLEQSQEY